MQNADEDARDAMQGQNMATYRISIDGRFYLR